MNAAKVVALGLLIGLHGLGLPLAAQSAAPSGDQLDGAQAAGESLGGLPLSVNPAPQGPLLAVLLSGDGGWAAGDKSLAKAFASDSVAVVGLNSPRYLERARTPDEAAGDLARILRHFLYTWNRERVIVVGYSRGADIGPFMVARLPEDLRKHVAMLVLLGPGQQASFKFNLLDVARTHADDGLPVEAEVAKLRDIPVLCIYGTSDHGAICQALSQARLARSLTRDRGHVVHGDEGPALVQRILAELRAPPHAQGAAGLR
jgi:type IV secretory pathway VirJ component